MHRYIPVLAKNAGFLEKVVQHKPENMVKLNWNGTKRFSGFNYHLVPFSFWKRPMHLLVAMGSLMFIIGFMLAYIGISNYTTCIMICATVCWNNLLVFIALTTMVLGTQLFLAGFLGEIILRQK
jgi:hypothetical protein